MFTSIVAHGGNDTNKPNKAGIYAFITAGIRIYHSWRNSCLRQKHLESEAPEKVGNPTKRTVQLDRGICPHASSSVLGSFETKLMAAAPDAVFVVVPLLCCWLISGMFSEVCALLRSWLGQAALLLTQRLMYSVV